MCGRYYLLERIDGLFADLGKLHPWDESSRMPLRYNIAPTQPIPVVVTGDNGFALKLVRWGFLPSWARDPAAFSLIINARSETAMEKPSFRAAMRHRRILIPASGFYEWKRFGKGRKSQAYRVQPAQGGLVAFGGLMETYADANGSEIDTACILTTAANPAFADIHHRLPLVIKPEDFSRWLDCKTGTPHDIAGLLHPVEDGYFEAVPVGDAVNKVANDGPDIQRAIDPADVETPKKPEDGQMSLF